MRYLVAAVLLISSALAYPIGENEGEQGGGVPLVISDYASVAKSEESGEVHSREPQAEVQRDVSHEHASPKVENDSVESSEDSSSVESREKQQDEAKPNPEPEQKSSQNEKGEHQAQPSEIINSEIAHDPVKEEPAKDKEPVPQSSEQVPQSDPVAPAQEKSDAEKESNSVQSQSSVVAELPISGKNSDSVQQEPVGRSDDPQPHQEDSKPSEELPKVPNPEVPAPNVLSDEHDVKPEIKPDVAVVHSDAVEVVQPQVPEVKEEPVEEKKVADDANPLIEPKTVPEESEKSKEDKSKSILSDPVPVHDDVKDEVKVAQDPVPEVKEDVKPIHDQVEVKSVDDPIVAKDETVKPIEDVVPVVNGVVRDALNPIENVEPAAVPNLVVAIGKSVQDEVHEVVSDELPTPASKSDISSKDESPKSAPESEALPEKLSEHNSSS